MQIILFNNQVQCRWDELRAGPWQTDSIMQFIDEQAAILEEAQVRNFERWQVLGIYLWPNAFIGNTYEEEITYLKTWTTARLNWMDANMIGNCIMVLKIISLGMEKMKMEDQLQQVFIFIHFLIKIK